MQIEGKLQEQNSSKQQPATMEIKDETYELYVDDTSVSQGSLESLSVSDRLGNTLRKVRHDSDGWVFVTSDNSVDKIYTNQKNFKARVYKLEGSFGLSIIAVVVIALLSYSFVVWGVPFVSKRIANSLPLETNKAIAKDALKNMDKYMLEKSNIPKERQEEIISHFNKKILPLVKDKHLEFKINFREWKMGGESIANAFALPSGEIVLTDKFVNLAQNNDELDSVILHEVGHVVHRHSLQSIIQGTFVSTLSTMVIGDSSGIGDLATGLGSLMINSKYSRGHESEADRYAFTKMLEAGIDPHSFTVIMNKMTAGEDNDKKESDTEDDTDIIGYFSSHPPTPLRTKIAEAYSRCFKEKRVKCTVDSKGNLDEK